MSFQSELMSSSNIKRSRPGARGARKVKTGCLTCRIRRKKCDEMKPSCSQCADTGRRCEFSMQPSLDLNIYRKPPGHIGYGEIHNLDYFKTVCTKEFCLYFEDSAWETIVLQAVASEPCCQYAALAIGAFSRSLREMHSSRLAALEYSTRQYNLAIQALRRQLQSSPNCELALLSSLMFIAIEVLHGHDNRVAVLVRSSFALLKNSPSTSLSYLWSAFSCIDRQATAFLRLENSVGDCTSLVRSVIWRSTAS